MQQVLNKSIQTIAQYGPKHWLWCCLVLSAWGSLIAVIREVMRETCEASWLIYLHTSSHISSADRREWHGSHTVAATHSPLHKCLICLLQAQHS